MVGIDSEAGPTEIAILADDTADASYVAADLISQAEHDPMAAVGARHRLAERLADEVDAELEKQVFATRHTARVQTALTGQQSAIVLVDDIEQGLDVVNAYAAEHLEIHTARRARDRGAGAQRRRRSSSAPSRPCRSATTAPAPTTCCRPPAAPATSSGLSVRSFLKSVHVIDYSRDALAEVADHVVTLAEAEDLPGHGAAVEVRFDPDRRDPT